MKKEYKVVIGLLSLFAVIVTTAHSFSMVTNGAQDASFGISQAKTFYLKGSFNSWSTSNEYILNDVTATMSEEEHKISEYSITKAFAKGDTLKVWDSSDHWYEQGVDNCSYVDKWGANFFDDENNNYVVPMTGTYSIYLKFYDTGDKQVYLTADNPATLYLKPNTNWLSDSARFAAYFFNASENEWLDMTLDGDYYKVSVPEGGYTGVIFCRMNGSELANNWDNKWNQTGDLSLGYRCEFEVPEGEGIWDVSSDATWRAR